MVLDALEDCYGLTDRDIFISIDHDEHYADEIMRVYRIAENFAMRRRRTTVTVQRSKLGIDVHKEWLISQILGTGHDAFIFLEDDIMPARDALRYFDWALTEFEYDQNVVSICGYRKTDTLKSEDLDKCFLVNWFTTWGWAMWADRWNRYYGNGSYYRKDIARWFGAGTSPNGHFDYWWSHLCETTKHATVFPSVSRVFNFGRNQGEHTQPDWFDVSDYNPVGAWQILDLPDRRVWVKETLAPNPGYHVIGQISR